MIAQLTVGLAVSGIGVGLFTWVLLWHPRPLSRVVFWTYVGADMLCVLLLLFNLLVVVGMVNDP